MASQPRMGGIYFTPSGFYDLRYFQRYNDIIPSGFFYNRWLFFL